MVSPERNVEFDHSGVRGIPGAFGVSLEMCEERLRRRIDYVKRSRYVINLSRVYIYIKKKKNGYNITAFASRAK